MVPMGVCWLGREPQGNPKPTFLPPNGSPWYHLAHTDRVGPRIPVRISTCLNNFGPNKLGNVDVLAGERRDPHPKGANLCCHHDPVLCCHTVTMHPCVAIPALFGAPWVPWGPQGPMWLTRGIFPISPWCLNIYSPDVGAAGQPFKGRLHW